VRGYERGVLAAFSLSLSVKRAGIGETCGTVAGSIRETKQEGKKAEGVVAARGGRRQRAVPEGR
jgi:hypothetical protein